MNERDVQRIPVVSRVIGDTLVELVYDAEKCRTALAVSRFHGLWNIEQELKIATGETLIPYAASNNLIANGCVLLPSGPAEYGLKDDLIADIRGYIHRYVDLSPEFELIAAYYVLLTWVYDAFAEVPYLRFLGDWGTGKTRALIAIGSICYKPFFASGASTVSPIFHIQDTFAGTLIFDEADMPFSDAKAELVKIFNNGTARGMPVLRSMMNRHKEINPQAFRVFGPKIVATRGRFEDQALESRFITEQTGAAPLRSDISISLPNAIQTEALELRNRLLHFRLCEFFKIKPIECSANTDGDPRFKQMALPLLALVDDLAVREEIRQALLVRFEQVRAEQEGGPENAILASALAAATNYPGEDIPVGEIARRYNDGYGDVFETRSSRWIGSVLRTTFHLTTRKSKGLYVVPAIEQTKIAALASRRGIIV
jgi:hypothetical protein